MKFGKFDLDELLALMDRHHVSEMSLRQRSLAIEIKKSGSAAHHSAAPQPRPAVVEKPVAEHAAAGSPLPPPPPAEIAGEKFYQVQAPLVGTFYHAPTPDASPFIEVGDKVKVGDTLCIIEAMKNMNEIQTDVNGIIREICAKNGNLVEFGQVLFKIEETSADS